MTILYLDFHQVQNLRFIDKTLGIVYLSLAITFDNAIFFIW
jgi:hypothetical protein